MNTVRSTLRWFTLAVGVLGSGVAVQAQVPSAGRGPIQPAAANSERLSFEQPLAWLREAKTNYGAVKDYTCNFSSQERINGKLGDMAIMQMKVRSQPFSVYMRWLSPDKDKGQEVVFVQGKNGNKMLVKSPSLPKILGWHPIDPADPRVLKNSRHTILEAGIGNMIDQTLRSWEADRDLGRTKVLPPAQANYNQRDCLKVELVHLDTASPCYRSVIYLEKVSKMPIRLENYSWPQKGGRPDGDVLETFSYFNIQFNTGLNDSEFNR